MLEVLRGPHSVCAVLKVSPASTRNTVAEAPQSPLRALVHTWPHALRCCHVGCLSAAGAAGELRVSLRERDASDVLLRRLPPVRVRRAAAGAAAREAPSPAPHLGMGVSVCACVSAASVCVCACVCECSVSVCACARVCV